MLDKPEKQCYNKAIEKRKGETKMETIKEYKNEIEAIKAKIEANKTNPHYFEATPIWDMHDNGLSAYENDMAMIRYCEAEIKRAEEREKERKEKEHKIAIKAAKVGMTIEAYKAVLAEEKKEKALEAKAKRYHKELAELNERKAYLEKWLTDYEAK